MVDDDRSPDPPTSPEPGHVGPRFEPPPPVDGASSRVAGFAGAGARRDAPLSAAALRPTPADPPPAPPPPLDRSMLDPDRHRRFAGRTLALLAVLAFLLLGVGAYVLLPHPGGTSPEERYLQHLDAYGLSDQFRSDQAALASGRRVCRRLEQGAPRTGYQRDFVAVKDLCPRYQEGFELRRTPEQLADVLATRLDAAGQADAFDSTSDAVRRAEGLCRELRDGHDQKGTPADRIAVEVYCPEKLFRFREFRKTTALGSFTLRVSKLDPLAPPISTTGPICTGAHQFAGYHLGTRVTVTNGQGDRLGVTSLRSGSGSSTECVFTFAVELTEGEDAYVFQVGDLPGESYSFDDVLMGQVRQELKSR